MEEHKEEEIINEILDITELAVETLDLNNTEDLKIISELIECCECANNLPNKRRKTEEWVKPWRKEQVDSFSFLMHELSSDLGMSPEIFDYILAKIENDIENQDTIMGKSKTPKEMLAATLRYLATGESFESTHYQKKISASLLFDVIPEVCEAICRIFEDEHLKFPTTPSEWEAIAENFAIKWKFPNCLGSLDGSYFYNFSGPNKIVLFALVDADCRFLYIDVGCIERANDEDFFLGSDLKYVINNREKYLPKDKVIGDGRKLPYVIISDDCYPLQKHIMKSYSHNTNKKKRQIFNMRLTHAKHVAEQAFEILTSRFRIFQTKINLSVENVELITKTCCVLHNLLSDKNKYYSRMPTFAVASASDPLRKVNLPPVRINMPSESFIAAQSVRQDFEDYFMEQSELLGRIRNYKKEL